jgi:sortase (surface protein transpeptidase)
MKLRFSATIAVLFIAAGVLIGYGRYQKAHHVTTTFQSVVGAAEAKNSVQPPKKDIAGKPVRIQLPSLKLDLAVIDGYYNTKAKTWTLTNDKVQYATITPLANNQGGNTFIYGHNRRGVFATLSHIKAGEKAIITTDNGHVFTYVFRSSLETDPYDASLFTYRGAPILTLQTCSGLWYQNRQLFTFDLEKVS